MDQIFQTMLTKDGMFKGLGLWLAASADTPVSRSLSASISTHSEQKQHTQENVRPNMWVTGRDSGKLH